MVKAGNIGEWSEVYAFLRLLADGRLYAADEDLNQIREMFLPIIKIIRKEGKDKHYEYWPNNESAQVEIYLDGKQILKLPASEFGTEADRLLYSIQTYSEGSLDVTETRSFIKSIYVEKLKAPSTDKSDIKVQLHDVNSGIKRIVGFSIKSELGGASTLLNASLATNFVYKIEGLNPNLMDKINSIDTGGKIQKRVKAIKDNGGTFTFERTENETFNNNLKKIDRSMSMVLAEMLLGYFSKEGNSCDKLTKYVSRVNPLSEDEEFYTYNVKELLCAVALGMMPATKWSGTDEATGGYIIVNKRGDVMAFYIFNRDVLKAYLFDNTKFDTPDTVKHRFGCLYEEDGEMRIKLNLQIRFV